MKDAHEAMTTTEVAARLGVARSTVLGYVHRGLLHATRTPGHPESRFDPSEVAGLPGKLRRAPAGMLGVAQVAARLNVDRTTVRRRAAAGKLPFLRREVCLVFSPGTIDRIAGPALRAVAEPEPVRLRPGRLPVEPLMRLSPSVAGMARVIGVDPALIRRARREGLTCVKADDWATALGRHPVEVWGDAWFDVAV